MISRFISYLFSIFRRRGCFCANIHWYQWWLIHICTGGGKSTSRNATTYTWPNMYQWWQVVAVVVRGGISTYRFRSRLFCMYVLCTCLSTYNSWKGAGPQKPFCYIYLLLINTDRTLILLIPSLRWIEVTRSIMKIQQRVKNGHS